LKQISSVERAVLADEQQNAQTILKRTKAQNTLRAVMSRCLEQKPLGQATAKSDPALFVWHTHEQESTDREESRMTQKLIFLDIDGTLLPPGGMSVPQSAKDAIRTAQANGHKVFLCTGRNYAMTEPLLDMDFDGFVCSAGGYVVCDETVLFDCPMEPELRDAVFKEFQARGVGCTLESKNMSFADDRMRAHFMRARGHKRVEDMSSEELRWKKAIESGEMVRRIADYKGEPVYKIGFHGEDENAIRAVEEKFGQDFIFCRLTMHQDDPEIHGELINRKFNKGKGIQCICDYLGCSLADTIGFGDSMNDREMTDVVGISVCMENGVKELKKLCDRVAPRVDDDGIAREFAELGLI
jgi:hypothetical protein